MPRELTDYEKEVFDAIQNASNMALVSTAFDGEDTAVIAAVIEDGEGYLVRPLAVIVTDAIFDRLTDPVAAL